MARPKREKRDIQKEEIIHLRGPSGLLPMQIHFPVYEDLIDEQIVQYEGLIKKEEDPEAKKTYEELIATLRGTILDAPTFTGFCIPIEIGQHNEYVVQRKTRRHIVALHLCKRDGSPYLEQREQRWYEKLLRIQPVKEELQPGAFVDRAYDAIMEASGFGMSPVAKDAVREAKLTEAEVRIRNLKKKLASGSGGSEKSPSATTLHGDSTSSPGRLPA